MMSDRSTLDRASIPINKDRDKNSRHSARYRRLHAFGHDATETQTQDPSDNHSQGGLGLEKDDRSNFTRTDSIVSTTQSQSPSMLNTSRRTTTAHPEYHQDDTGHTNTNILRHPHSNRVFERSALLQEEGKPYDAPPGEYYDGGRYKRWNIVFYTYGRDGEEQSGKGHEVDEVEREMLSELENDYRTRGW
ncbi:uncharacterized protein L199_005074 [Kwoniella botswanensis]|uniref:uncharacterized protein n=1 Tax=Kwoniella botswanensis TaxID=1268659 RepID=UPI00315D1634